MNRFFRSFSWKIGLKVSGWLLILLASMEVFIRLFIFSTPTRVIDPIWGVVPSPNTCYRRGTEGFGVTCYSLHGEIDTPYHDGRPVVVLGDSYTEATQVDNDEKFVSIAEVSLRERGLNVDLHNLGDSGLNNADYAYLAELVDETYSPEIVVLQVNANDFPASLDSDNDNHFEQAGDELILHHEDDDQSDIAIENIARSSSLMTYTIFRWGEISPKIVFNSHSEASPTSDDLNNFGNSDVKVASEEQIILQAQALIKAYSKSSLVLLFIPNIPVISDTDISWTNSTDDYFVSVLESIDGITVLYPRDGFRALYEEKQILPRGFFNTTPNMGHINEYGHILVGNALADGLEGILR